MLLLTVVVNTSTVELLKSLLPGLTCRMMQKLQQQQRSCIHQRSIVRPINAQDGDLLPVSAFKGIEDGHFGIKVLLHTKNVV